jgi:trehalose 2-sulfotransferase
MAGFSAYILCTSPRSGSTLLCDLMASTGVAGQADSYFAPDLIAYWMQDLGLHGGPDPFDLPKAQAYQAAVMAAGRGGTQMFGLRLMAGHMPDLQARLGVLYPDHPTDLARITAAFGRVAFLHLHRADKLAQAISFEKARQSGLWHVAPDGTEVERLSPPMTPIYDRAALQAQIARFEQTEAAQDQWFAAQAVQPLRLTYEALAQDPLAVLRRVLEHIGLEPSAAEGCTPGVAKLADATSLDWAERYRAEQG